jgi:hypothetical protein
MKRVVARALLVVVLLLAAASTPQAASASSAAACDVPYPFADCTDARANDYFCQAVCPGHVAVACLEDMPPYGWDYIVCLKDPF